jgi:hypothetical protein
MRKGVLVKRGVITVLITVFVSAAATAALWPAAAGAGTFTGIVVARQHGTMLVASQAGALRAVRGSAAVGARIAGTHVVGRATHARIRGVLVRQLGRTLVLSSNRHLIAIPNRVGRVVSSASDTSPSTTLAPGAVVAATVQIQNGELEEEDAAEVGVFNASTIAVQATVQAVAPGTVTLDVQGQSVTVPLPAGLTLPASLVGQTVSLNLSLGNGDDQGDDNGGDGNGGNNGNGGHGGDGGGDG